MEVGAVSTGGTPVRRQSSVFAGVVVGMARLRVMTTSRRVQRSGFAELGLLGLGTVLPPSSVASSPVL
jgi:hypothetical protein